MEEEHFLGFTASAVQPDLHSARPWVTAMSDDLGKSNRPAPPPSRDWGGADSARPIPPSPSPAPSPPPPSRK